MVFPLVLPWVIWAAVAQTQITPTNGPPFSARLLAITEGHVELATGNQLSELAVGKIRRLAFADGSEAKPFRSAGGNSPQQATLADGSGFHFEQLTLDAGVARFRLPSGTQLDVPVGRLHRVQLQPLTEPQWTQWQAISQSRTSADVLVLVRSADALEKLEGVISAINSSSVSFEFGGQQIEAPLTKLAGIRFFVNPDPTANAAGPGAGGHAKLTGIVLDEDGNRWLASHIELGRDSPSLELTLQSGVTLTLPLKQLREIDFSSGSMQFLAELEPLQRESQGRFELGVDIEGADLLFGARRREVRLADASSSGPSLEFLGGGAVEYRVPADFARLQGSVELRPSGSRFTPCDVAIRLENQLLWQERLSQPRKRWPIDLKVEPERRLRIEVVAGSQTPVGDVVLWHELRFVK